MALTVADLLNMEPEQSKQSEQIERAPMLQFEFESDGKGNNYPKEGQIKIIRFLEEIEKFVLQPMHYVDRNGVKGYFACGRQPVVWTDKQGKKQVSFKGVCVECELDDADKAKVNEVTEHNKNNPGDKKPVPRRKHARKYFAFAKIEEKIEERDEEDNVIDEKTRYEVKGIKLKFTDAFYPQSTAAFKQLTGIAKLYKGKITGRWITVDEKGQFNNYESVSAEDKKRKVEHIDLSTRLARTYEELVERLNKGKKANSEVVAYDNETDPIGLLDEDVSDLNF